MISGMLAAGTGSGMTTVIPLIDQSDRELLNAMHELMTEWLEQAVKGMNPG